jgi:hypothetical protein
VKENPNWYQQMKIVDVRTRRPALAPSYDVREESGTWTVYDCQSECAAALNGVLWVGLGLNEADDLAAVLSRVELQRFASRNADRVRIRPACALHDGNCLCCSAASRQGAWAGDLPAVSCARATQGFATELTSAFEAVPVVTGGELIISRLVFTRLVLISAHTKKIDANRHMMVKKPM